MVHLGNFVVVGSGRDLAPIGRYEGPMILGRGRCSPETGRRRGRQWIRLTDLQIDDVAVCSVYKLMVDALRWKPSRQNWSQGISDFGGEESLKRR